MWIHCLKDNTENPCLSLLTARLSAWSTEETQMSHTADNYVHFYQEHFNSEIIYVSVNYKS